MTAKPSDRCLACDRPRESHHPESPCPRFVESPALDEANAKHRLLAQIVKDFAEQVKQLEAEKQAVLLAINLYGDETLHKALDDIGWVPRDPAPASHPDTQEGHETS